MANPNDLNTNIVINVSQQEGMQKSDGKKTNKGTGRAQNYKNIHDINFTSVAKLGLAIRTVRMGNETVGAYTGDRLTQRKVQMGMTFAQYGVGLAVAGGPIGIGYLAGDLAYRSLSYNIDRTRKNQMASYLKDLSGNNSRNHSRANGEKL